MPRDYFLEIYQGDVVNKDRLYNVLSLQIIGKKFQWVVLTEKPVPRSEAAVIVAAQWKLGRMARLVGKLLAQQKTA